jgi:hypothetical protein
MCRAARGRILTTAGRSVSDTCEVLERSVELRKDLAGDEIQVIEVAEID